MELLLDKEELKYYNQDIFANVAVGTLFDVFQQTEEENKFAKLFETLDVLKKQQPHNIVLHNATSHFLLGLSKKQLKEEVKERYNSTLKLIKESNKNVEQIGSKRIKTGSIVFISSFNNQLVSVLLNAAKYKQFAVFAVKDENSKVYLALSKKLKSHNIDFVEINWHELNKTLKKTDLCLIGGEVLTKERGVFVNKGANMVAETSQKNNVPVYVCLHTWKYDHKNIIKNHLSEEHHEYLSKNLINSYICEYGIFKPEHIIQEARFYNKKLFT